MEKIATLGSRIEGSFLALPESPSTREIIKSDEWSLKFTGSLIKAYCQRFELEAPTAESAKDLVTVIDAITELYEIPSGALNRQAITMALAGKLDISEKEFRPYGKHFQPLQLLAILKSYARWYKAENKKLEAAKKRAQRLIDAIIDTEKDRVHRVEKLTKHYSEQADSHSLMSEDDFEFMKIIGGIMEKPSYMALPDAEYKLAIQNAKDHEEREHSARVSKSIMGMLQTRKNRVKQLKYHYILSQVFDGWRAKGMSLEAFNGFVGKYAIAPTTMLTRIAQAASDVVGVKAITKDRFMKLVEVIEIPDDAKWVVSHIKKRMNEQ